MSPMSNELSTLYILVSSADNFCKQFGPISKRRAWSVSKKFDIGTMRFQKEFERIQQTTSKIIQQAKS